MFQMWLFIVCPTGCLSNVMKISAKYQHFTFCSFTVLNKLKAVDELKERLIAIWSDFWQDIIDTAIGQWRKRHPACVRTNGGHFKHLLWTSSCKQFAFFHVFLVQMASVHRVRFLANVNSRYMLSPVRLLSVYVVCQAVEIFGNFSMPFGTLAIHSRPRKILRRYSQGTPPPEGLNSRVVAKYSDFGPIEGYISETVQDRRNVSINH